MRLLHTADWHIGQTLAGFSREAEHRAFLDHLGQLIVEHDVDALLVAGDVFDGINPSGEAQRMLYSALARYVRQRPGLTVVMIAGNHDPAARLEAPQAILRELGVHVVGTMQVGPGQVDLGQADLRPADPRLADLGHADPGPADPGLADLGLADPGQADLGQADLGRHLIPLSDRTGVRAYVLAIPFLRAADLPGLTMEVASGEGAVVRAVRTLHATLTEAAVAASHGLPLIAMGHLTCSGAEASLGAERPIRIGGEDAVPPDIYPKALSYVALGHLHKPQSLDGGRVRYAGSPFPLSASEIPYVHGVTLIELGETLTHRHIPIPRLVPNLRLPAKGAIPLADLPALLQGLALDAACPRDLQPFVSITLSADRPASQLKAEADALLDRHPVRVASLVIDRAVAALPDMPPPSLAETTPEALFALAFHQAHGFDPAPVHLSAFRDALSEV